MWIEAALAATGTATVRRRRLPAPQVIWLVIGMALFRERPIADVVGRAVDAMKCQAVPDSQENVDEFGKANGGERGASGYPLIRMAALMALRSHLVVNAAFGSYRNGEHYYAAELWSALPDDSLTVVDRNFWSAAILIVRQEVWGMLIAYNLVRLEMERVADEVKVKPTRISFSMVLDMVCSEWWWLSGTSSPGAIPRHLQRLRANMRRCILPERTRERSYPRAVKIKMSNYAKKRA